MSLMTISSPVPTRNGGRLGMETLLRWFPVLLLFATYPLALLVPVRLGVQLGFQLALPALFWMSVLGSAYLLLTPHRAVGHIAATSAGRRRAVALRVLLPALLAFYSLSAILSHTALSTAVFVQLSCFAVPMYAALCPRQLLPRRLPAILTLLWVVQAVHGLWQWATRIESGIVALAGNRNWMATLVAVLTPWVWFAILQHTRSRAPGSARRHWRRWLVAGLLCAGSGLTGFFLVYQGYSRGTWLVLGAYLALYEIAPRFSRTMRVCLALIALFVCVQLFNTWPDRFVAAVSNDIRLPLYASTLRLIHDRPLLGVGPGNFRREFATYRSAAHKSRTVAAPVTAHPHNELLHVTASAGIPVGLLWVALLWPVLRPPRRHSPFWRLVHFSAFLIVAHSLLDKVLVQAPTSLLGLFFVGMLWRPFLRVRAEPAPSRRRFVLPVAVAAAAYALIAGFREIRTGFWLRRAYIKEAAGAYEGAYDAYRRSTEIQPRNVRTHAFAGILANNKLRDPERALVHLRRAFELEPDFAHVNGEIGLALGGLRRHLQALPFFQRDARLYPFDIIAHQRLFLCGLATGAVPGMTKLAQRLGDLRHRQCVQALGAERVRELAGGFRIALSRGDTDAACRYARALAEPLPEATAEPVFLRMAGEFAIPAGYAKRGFGTEDAAYWQELLERHRRVRRDGLHTAAALHRLHRVDSGPDKLGPDAACDLAQVGWEAGFEVASIRAAYGAKTGLAELRRDRAVWLLGPQSAPVADRRAAELGTDPALRAQFGLSTAEPAEYGLVLPLHPLDFISRTQTLGQILTRTLGPELVPRERASASLRLRRYSALVASEAQSQPAPTATPAAVLRVTYDAALFRRFAAELTPADTRSSPPPHSGPAPDRRSATQ